MKKAILLFSIVAASAYGAPVFEHAIYEARSLDGTWEMAYLPYAWESMDMTKFSGVKIESAVPGYWEDMVCAFRAAGMKDEFRINPSYGKRTFPLVGYAADTSLPNIRGSFLYRRTIDLAGVGGSAVLAFEGVRNQVHVWINGEFVRIKRVRPFRICFTVYA